MNRKIYTLKPKVIIASKNKGKVLEFKKLLSSLPIKIVNQPKDIEIEENGTTFSENARIKAISVAKITGEFSLSDDSGLCVPSLGGAPGIHSARYAKNDLERINRLLKELEGKENREAYFCSALCFASPEEGVLFEVLSKCEGVITTSPRGTDGFGYDPIFEVIGIGLTFSEMGIEKKETISHRGLAFQKLMPQLKEFFE